MAWRNGEKLLYREDFARRSVFWFKTCTFLVFKWNGFHSFCPRYEKLSHRCTRTAYEYLPNVRLKTIIRLFVSSVFPFSFFFFLTRKPCCEIVCLLGKLSDFICSRWSKMVVHFLRVSVYRSPFTFSWWDSKNI